MKQFSEVVYCSRTIVFIYIIKMHYILYIVYIKTIGGHKSVNR